MASLAGCSSEDTSQSDSVTPENTGAFVVARVGPILAARVGQTADLSGQNSYTLSDQPLSFSWSFTHKPDSSEAVLQDTDAATPSFIADARGTYMAQLVVSAEGVASQRMIQQVVATVAPERSTGPFNHAGLSSSCSSCHNDDFDTILSKIGNHVATGGNCETCHTPLGYVPVAFLDHEEVFGECSECHNGVLAVGKSEFHTSTNGKCNDCHNTSSFLILGPDGSFDHSGITGVCSGCHNGTVAIGATSDFDDTPPGTHPVTSSECVFCHTTTSFLNAHPDHTGPDVVGNSCNSCHGSSAQGEPDGHPAMSVDCQECHGIVTFSLDGVFNHRTDITVQSCETCHTRPNSINAVGKTTNHIDTTTDCGQCHNTEAFSPAFVDHTGFVKDCASCHGAGASGKSVNHMPTTEDCSVCHTPGTFSTGSYDHAGVVSGCASCHDNVISVGKLFNHFPTIPDSQDCAVCHTTATFVGATFDHSGITGTSCATCHNGGYTTTSNSLYGKPGTHLPTTQDCSFCHTSGVAFAQDLFSHNAINSQCESCHSGDSIYIEVGAIGKKVNHIPAGNECDDCHQDTNTFTSTTFSMTHDTITSGCGGCHNSVFSTGKPGGHLPTGQDCDLCHTTTALFKPSTFAHTGISGDCASCHDGSGNFVGLGATGKTPGHSATTADCGVCHNTVDFAEVFDHSGRVSNCVECHGDGASGALTKKNSGHVSTTQDCSVCHVTSTFTPAVFDHTGIVSNCASCHDGVTATGKDAKTNPDHITTTEDCSVCHVPTVFSQADFSHQNISNNCDTCHDGTTVFGKHNNHVPTNKDCALCHQTTGILPATFSHDGILDNCSSCHAAGLATPKTVNHIGTSQDCGVCHTPNTFIPATFDHTGIVNSCSSCHGVTATPKSNDHLATSRDCHFCHTTTSFTGGSWVHDSSATNNCDSCHDLSNEAPGHLPTVDQCDDCHTTNTWVPANFSHSSSGDYPGDHRRDPGCTGCHGTIPDVDWGWSQYAPYCAACHAGDFDRKGDHIGGENGTITQNRDCSGGGTGCHRVNDRDFD